MSDTNETDETITTTETETVKKPRKKAVRTAVKKKVKKAVAKKVKKVKAKKAAAKNGNAKRNGGGSKKGEQRVRNGSINKIIGMLKRGTTREALLKATGWKAISPRQVAEGQGLKLKTNKEKRPYRYQAA